MDGPDGGGDAPSSGERALAGLLHASHLAPPHAMPELVAEHAELLGAHDALAYLADLQQTVLVPFVGSQGPGRGQHLEELLVDTTLAGRAFQHGEVQVQTLVTNGDFPDAVRVWLPLLDGTERVGVLAVRIDDRAALERDGGLLLTRLMRYASLVAEMLVSKTLYGDTIVRVRRRAQMGLAAEIQWGLLPPLTFASPEVVVAAALEPAYEVAGDSVDYAVDAGVGRFAVFDGMGHGLRSAQLAATTVAAYRNARRNGRTLSATAAMVDVVTHDADGDAFVTGVLAELDLATGVLSWVNAGHPEPLLLRRGRLVRTLHVEGGLPFGLSFGLTPGQGHPVGTEHLQPGDRVLIYTDGITEARAPSGQQFGLERLVDMLVRAEADALPAPETMRRVVRALLEHQQNELSDDATFLVVEWHGANHGRLLPDVPAL